LEQPFFIFKDFVKNSTFQGLIDAMVGWFGYAATNIRETRSTYSCSIWKYGRSRFTFSSNIFKMFEMNLGISPIYYFKNYYFEDKIKFRYWVTFIILFDVATLSLN
jgi:hypothetical protein